MPTKERRDVIVIGKTAAGEDLAFPVAAAASRFVIVGKSRAGKTNSDVVLVESFIPVGVPTLVFDRIGNMWGMRSSADGEHAGLPIAIFGGLHGDVDLRAD